MIQDMIPVKEYIQQRDLWIFEHEGFMRLSDIANQVGLSVSRVKQILARMRKTAKVSV